MYVCLPAFLSASPPACRPACPPAGLPACVPDCLSTSCRYCHVARFAEENAKDPNKARRASKRKLYVGEVCHGGNPRALGAATDALELKPRLEESMEIQDRFRLP